MTFADHFSGVSAAYAAFRPTYPEALFEYLANEAPGRGQAWDVGTGSGQAAVGLARYFAHVLATDASAAQLERATPDSRVTYRVAVAHASGLDDHTVDLLTAAQALHWFDRDRFWQEARRVLRPRGVIAVWTYALFQIAPDIDAVVRRFYSSVLGPFWPPERRLTEERYQTIEFPFDETAAPSFAIERRVNLEDVAGYIRTWSATRAFVKHHQTDPVDALIKDLTLAWRSPLQRRLARWPVAIRIGRV